MKDRKAWHAAVHGVAKNYFTTVALLIFFLDDLFIDISGVLKSAVIIALLSISPFMFVSVYTARCYCIGDVYVKQYISSSCTDLFLSLYGTLSCLSLSLCFVVISICIKYPFLSPHFQFVSFALNDSLAGSISKGLLKYPIS